MKSTWNRRQWWMCVMAVAMVVLLVGAIGCEFSASEGDSDADEETTQKVELATALDDGTLAILADYVDAGVVTGSTYGGVSPETSLLCPGAAIFQQMNLRTRALYRFDISDWTSGDITFATKCIMSMGSAGDLQLYVLDDLQRNRSVKTYLILHNGRFFPVTAREDG